jgi:hypothetical protein
MAKLNERNNSVLTVPCLWTQNYLTERHLIDKHVKSDLSTKLMLYKYQLNIKSLCHQNASQSGASQPSARQPGASQPNGSQPNAIQPNAIQPNAIQPNAIQPKCHLAKCQLAKCQLAKCHLANCQMPNTKCQMPNTKCQMPNASWPNASWPNASWPNSCWQIVFDQMAWSHLFNSNFLSVSLNKSARGIFFDHCVLKTFLFLSFIDEFYHIFRPNFKPSSPPSLQVKWVVFHRHLILSQIQSNFCSNLDVRALLILIGDKTNNLSPI